MKVKRVFRRWSEDEINTIISLYPKMTARQLKQYLPKRTPEAIRRMACKLRRLGKLTLTKRSKVDVEKFKEMWLRGVPIKQIAKVFGINETYVYAKSRKLGLPSRGKGFGPLQRGLENEQKIIDYIKAKGGYCNSREIQNSSAVRRLISKGILFTIKFNLKRGVGGYRRKDHHLIFKEPYIFKTYYCLGRTGVVRLLCEALKKPEDKQTRKVLSGFLRRYLTDAEKVAVLWKLGVRPDSRTIKSTIQVDGIIFPKKLRQLANVGSPFSFVSSHFS